MPVEIILGLMRVACMMCCELREPPVFPAKCNKREQKRVCTYERMYVVLRTEYCTVELNSKVGPELNYDFTYQVHL